MMKDPSMHLFWQQTPQHPRNMKSVRKPKTTIKICQKTKAGSKELGFFSNVLY